MTFNAGQNRSGSYNSQTRPIRVKTVNQKAVTHTIDLRSDLYCSGLAFSVFGKTFHKARASFGNLPFTVLWSPRCIWLQTEQRSNLLESLTVVAEHRESPFRMIQVAAELGQKCE